jgi:serine O-acetyltransferase
LGARSRIQATGKSAGDQKALAIGGKFGSLGLPGFFMENAINQISDGILTSYGEVGGLNNIDGLNLPSKTSVATICEDFLKILFPGFHDEEPVHKKSLPVLTRHRVVTLMERLNDQVCKSLRVGEPECPESRANRIVVECGRSLPGVREILQTDIEAAFEGDPAALSREEIILSYPFLEAIAIQRVAHSLYRESVPLIPRMMTEWAHARTGIDIHPGARIGSYFFIDHGSGVVVGETCVIGHRVKLYHGVTLGARSFAKDDSGRLVKGGQRHPRVEDRVTIYPGSTILGGETTIGEGSTIGANVFLMQSVPKNSLVIYEETQLKILSKLDREREEALEWTI